MRRGCERGFCQPAGSASDLTSGIYSQPISRGVSAPGDEMQVGLYIQVPFCQTKCTYCNFSTGVFGKWMYQPYVDAVCRELTEHVALHRSVGVEASPELAADTLYVGGGTPSLLETDALGQILDRAQASFPGRFREVTLEADPETVTPGKGEAWRDSGINRISLGVQSLDDRELAAAGRLHRRADVLSATRTLRAAGFANLSFDLIAGLPHQTAQSWEDSLAALAELRPEHVSVYLLEIDEGSRLGREVLAGGRRYSAHGVPSDDAMAGFYETACERLREQGYEHYEISNWSLPGFASRHNVKYWRRQPYLGFGAGAHSFNRRQRWANAQEPRAYLTAIEQGRLPAEQIEVLTREQALDEELFLGLRQLEGIDLAALEQRYRVGLRGRVQNLCEQGLLELEGSRLRLAPNRLTIANEVFLGLLG